MSSELVTSRYKESIQILISSGDALAQPIANATNLLVQSLLTEQKVLTCGLGPSKMLAQHFAELLVNFYEIERPSLPAICLSPTLTHLSNQVDHYDSVEQGLARQIRTIGLASDLLIAFAPTGTEKAIIYAVEAALTKDMSIIILSGGDGGEVTGLLGEHDIEIRVPSHRISRILEAHLFHIHCMCDLIDSALFNQDY